MSGVCVTSFDNEKMELFECEGVGTRFFLHNTRSTRVWQ